MMLEFTTNDADGTVAVVTLISAMAAALIAGAGLAWSIIAFLLTRRTTFRDGYQARLEHALRLIGGGDPSLKESGLHLLGSLVTSSWITAEDRRNAIDVLSAVDPKDSATSSEKQTINELARAVHDALDSQSVFAARTAGNDSIWEVVASTRGKGKYFFRGLDSVGKVVVVSENFTSKVAAENALRSFRERL